MNRDQVMRRADPGGGIAWQVLRCGRRTADGVRTSARVAGGGSWGSGSSTVSRWRSSRRARLLETCASVACALLVGAGAAHAEAGAPDPAFGDHGSVVLPTAARRSITQQIAAFGQPDGRIAYVEQRAKFAISKSSFRLTGASVSIARRSATGADAGRSRQLAVPTTFTPSAAHPLADGDVVVAGALQSLTGATSSLCVVRMHPDGSAAAQLGADGIACVALSSVPQLARGKAWLATVDDASVADDGSVRFVISQQHVRIEKGGFSSVAGSGPVVLTSLRPDGALDTTFSGGAVALAPASGSRSTSDVSSSLAPAPGGGTYVAFAVLSSSTSGTAQTVTLARYTAQGALDTTFAGGRIDVAAATADTTRGPVGVSVLRDGDVLLRTDTSDESSSPFAGVSSPKTTVELHRYGSDGAPRASFGQGGRATLTTPRLTTGARFGFVSARTGFRDVVLEQPDGKLLVLATAGPTSSSYNERVVLRSTPQGVLDTTFGSNGVADVPAAPPTARAVAAPTGFVDVAGRLVLVVSSADVVQRTSSNSTSSIATQTSTSLVRLLGGDVPTPAATVGFRHVAGCGARLSGACTWGSGPALLHGIVRAGGHGIADAQVVVRVSRPAMVLSSPAFAVATTTRADGSFAVRIPVSRIAPGSWRAQVSLLAGAHNQRAEGAGAAFLTLGTRATIALYASIERARALASVLDEVVGYSVVEDFETDTPLRQCATVSSCTQDDATLGRLTTIGRTASPGHAAVQLGKPGVYSIRSRVDAPGLDLVFVVRETGDDTFSTCEGSVTARKRWCPGGEWDVEADDPYSLLGLNSDSFD